MPARYIFLFSLCEKFSSGMFGKMRPPPRHSGDEVIPARARPVPFWRKGFLGLDSVMVIADTVDDNLLLASRNLANVLVVEPRYADPLSLVFYKKVLVTKAAVEQLKEMLA